jgi:hypothetical protein
MLSTTLAEWLVRLAGLYVGAGALFAVPFAVRWAGRLDPVAQRGTWGFRLLLLPGAAALWPLLAWRLLEGASRPPRNPFLGRPR